MPFEKNLCKGKEIIGNSASMTISIDKSKSENPGISVEISRIPTFHLFGQLSGISLPNLKVNQ
jgi:hypothetical protein